jgi:hypothetical protein
MKFHVVKNIFISFHMKSLAILFLGSFTVLSVSGQNDVKSPAKEKSWKNQNELPNDVFAGYGYGSLFMTNPYVDHSYQNYPEISNQKQDAVTNGTFIIGYNRRISKVVMIGFVASYMNCSNTGNYSLSGSNQNYDASLSDNIFSGLTMFTFNYLNKPIVRIYSAAGMGVAVSFSTVQGTDPGAISETDRQLMFGGQLTLFGIRVGRSLGAFFEFGVGTNTMLSCGISYQFRD